MEQNQTLEDLRQSSEMHDRLKFLRIKNGFERATHAAAALGIPYQTYANHENGNRGIPRDAIARYAQFFKTSPAWLLTGKGQSVSDQNSNKSDVLSVEVLGTTEAGIWREAGVAPLSIKGEVRVPKVPGFENIKQFALRVAGNSMNLIAQDGDYVICADVRENGLNAKDGDIVVVERERAGLVETTLKELRITASGEKELWPKSTDPDFQEPLILSDVPEDDVTISVIGIALATHRRIQNRG